METTNSLDVLRQLQTLDAQLYRLRREKQQKPVELEQVKSEVASQEAESKSVESKFKDLQLAQKEDELDLESREANIRKLQSQLFQLKTNKEYTAMQHEIDSLKADKSLLEEAILRRFDATDQVAKERQLQTQRLTAAQQKLEKERVRLNQELELLNQKIAEIEEQRKTLTPAIQPELLTIYEKILVLRDGLALVPLLQDSCGGCHRRMPPQVVNEVFLKTKVVMCESCNRILYFDEAHSKL
ncbi:MAG: hypothetical protein HYT88_03750 [Candidatus Omnitrophica bacterium]|nr:hypothetical protein [Candidatus Omnitrophota bacterium]